MAGLPVIHLAHVNIRTRRFAEMVDFYARVLSLDPTRAETRPDSTAHAWMRDAHGNPVIHIQEGGPDGPSDGGFHHIAFDCDDIGAWRERLDALGVPFTQTRFESARLDQLNLVDPDGLRLELSFRSDP